MIRVPPDSWRLPPPSPYFPEGFPPLRGLPYLPEPFTSLSGLLEPPESPQFPNFRTSAFPKFVRCRCHCLSLFSERPTSLDPAPRLALPAFSTHLCRWSHCCLWCLPLSLLLCPGILLPCFSARSPVAPSLCSLSLPFPFLSLPGLWVSDPPIRPSWLCVWSS